MADQSPRAFMSYTRIDDQRDGGRITNLREQLSGEVQMQTGKPFEIFQDVRDIEWGQSAKARIETSLDEVTFLIPILTPSFFNSEACLDEVRRFLEHERELDRDDLILPVYYVGHPPFDSREAREGDEVAVALAAHQWIDWREMRHESSTSAAVGRMLERMALQVRDALDRVAASNESVVSEPSVPPDTGATRRGRSSQPPAIPPESVPDAQQTLAETDGGAEKTETSGPAEKTETTTLVVDQLGAGQFNTIGGAIEAASAGDRIMVRPGEYQEGLILDKPLEVIGDGDVDEIVVEAEGQDTVAFRATMGRVANLTLRQTDESNCVDIAQGRLILEDCDITSHRETGVAIHGGADPLILRNRIHGCGKGGIDVYESGNGTIEDNDIFANAYSGVRVRDGGNPTVRRNRIHDGKQGGVFVYSNGKGTIEDNDIFGNAYSGVWVSEGGNPTVRRNRIHDGKQNGVFVYENGKGTIEDNDIFGNALAGVQVSKGGNPTVRRNRIHDGKQAGVFVFKNGKGTI